MDKEKLLASSFHFLLDASIWSSIVFIASIIKVGDVVSKINF